MFLLVVILVLIVPLSPTVNVVFNSNSFILGLDEFNLVRLVLLKSIRLDNISFKSISLFNENLGSPIRTGPFFSFLSKEFRSILLA
jgi:hypothetical protein